MTREEQIKNAYSHMGDGPNVVQLKPKYPGANQDDSVNC